MNNSKDEVFTFVRIPQNADEFKAMADAASHSEFKTAALSVLALLRYETSPEDALAMINVLKGPKPLTPYDISFIKERIKDKPYKVRSFFMGADVKNNYTPSEPLKITVSSNPYSYDAEGYAVLYLQSAGADAKRPVRLRKKASTGEWFLWEIQYLADIREPESEDPWA